MRSTRFVAKMLEKSATLVRIGTLAEVGTEVDRFVRAHGASGDCACRRRWRASSGRPSWASSTARRVRED